MTGPGFFAACTQWSNNSVVRGPAWPVSSTKRAKQFYQAPNITIICRLIRRNADNGLMQPQSVQIPPSRPCDTHPLPLNMRSFERGLQRKPQRMNGLQSMSMYQSVNRTPYFARKNGKNKPNPSRFIRFRRETA